ncbi:MAG: 3-deoxy-D-manno-octulosonic acid transferase [Chitinophagaceae bacterium]|jgi:3-deoxy-D-manno-octulosonic-acid transferase|nr:3-deoxy-D-manno-octulosonic acid transferase [Chitinophagaceae bacterium]
MHILFYNLFLYFYALGIRLAALFNPKARLWLEGRKNIFEKLSSVIAGNTAPLVWFHCASLGEFEQGQPLMKAYKTQYPEHKILLTFFSPSGYEVQKNDKNADYIFYLPMDSRPSAKKFLSITKPALIIFIKYEYWYYFITEIKEKKMPFLLVSAIFRKEQPFFQWYGKLHKYMLQCFTHFFLQNQLSAKLLEKIEINNFTVSGDTRFDRVLAIKNSNETLPEIAQFCENKKVIVAGSTWSADDEVLGLYANTHPEIRFIIAPHELSEERLQECEKRYCHVVFYSGYIKGNIALDNINTLIIDNIGMLSKLYRYATVCYVGGGFGGDGVHNVLEAAVYAKPVIFGPVYEKYDEAVNLINSGGGISVEDAPELKEELNNLLNDAASYAAASQAAGNYVLQNGGATERVMNYIFSNHFIQNAQ